MVTFQLSPSGPGSHTEAGLVLGHERGRTEQTDSCSTDRLPGDGGITHLISKPTVLVRNRLICLLPTPVFPSEWTRLIGISGLASPLPSSSLVNVGMSSIHETHTLPAPQKQALPSPHHGQVSPSPAKPMAGGPSRPLSKVSLQALLPF